MRIGHSWFLTKRGERNMSGFGSSGKTWRIRTTLSVYCWRFRLTKATISRSWSTTWHWYMATYWLLYFCHNSVCIASLNVQVFNFLASQSSVDLWSVLCSSFSTNPCSTFWTLEHGLVEKETKGLLDKQMTNWQGWWSSQLPSIPQQKTACAI